MKPLRLIPDGTKFDFIRLRFAGFAISLLLVFASLGLLFTKGLNFGVDFAGGAVIEVRMEPAPDISQLRAQLDGLGLGAISIQQFGTPNDVMIRMPQQAGDETAQKVAQSKVNAAINSFVGEGGKAEFRRVEFVGPQVGSELKKAGIIAVLLATFGIMAYIWFRFEWQFGVTTVLTLLHDAIIMLGFFSLTGEEFNLATVAAILTITGYSVNDTVVIFDYIRDTLRKYRKMEMGEVLNLAMNRTLARTIMTSMTTTLAMVALWIFGGEVIRGFTNALLLGIALGTYSSIFISSNTLYYLNLRKSKRMAEEE